MSEPNKPETQPFFKRLLRDSFYGRLPWKQVMQKKVLSIIVATVALLALLTVPQMASDAFHKAPAGAAMQHALAAISIGLLLWAFMGLMFVFFVAVFWQFTLDIIQSARAIHRGIKAVPALFSSFLSACGRGWATCGRAYQRV